MRRPLAMWVALLGAAGGLEDYRADDWDGSPVVYTGELKMPPDWVARSHAEGRWFATDYGKEFGLDWDDLPQKWSWDDVSGQSYVTRVLNQNEPQYCGSCWAHAALSSLADRIKIARAAQGSGAGYDVSLAVQVVLNCAKHVAGTCSGGFVGGVWKYIAEGGGIEYESCQNYLADDAKTCTAEDKCRLCTLNESNAHPTGSVCWGIPDAPAESRAMGFWSNGLPKANISNYGWLAGERYMRAEILTRGPIVCLVRADPLNMYKGGIIDAGFDGELSHAISVIGWGEEDGVPYWKCRNSWGAAWGENGFFRVKRNVTYSVKCVPNWNCTTSEADHASAIGIETSCSYAIPYSWGFTGYHSDTGLRTDYYDVGTVAAFWDKLSHEHEGGPKRQADRDADNPDDEERVPRDDDDGDDDGRRRRDGRDDDDDEDDGERRRNGGGGLARFARAASGGGDDGDARLDGTISGTAVIAGALVAQIIVLGVGFAGGVRYQRRRSGYDPLAV